MIPPLMVPESSPIISQAASVLELHQLRYERGDRIILKGIDWKVQPKEYWVVLGPNGCGKTSLINCLTGYEMATAGEITIGDAEYGKTDWREVRKHIGVVTSTLTYYLEPGEPVLDAVVSGRNAMINLVGEVDPAWIEEAKVLLGRIGCSHLISSRWGVLSQGERQKILICRALMAQFEVLILDEPCAGLDPVARENFLQWLQSFASDESAPSLILVTHHVEEIMPCFTHALLMKQGEVVSSGAKEMVLNSDSLSSAYGSALRLESDGMRYRLSFASRQEP